VIFAGVFMRPYNPDPEYWREHEDEVLRLAKLKKYNQKQIAEISGAKRHNVSRILREVRNGFTPEKEKDIRNLLKRCWPVPESSKSKKGD